MKKQAITACLLNYNQTNNHIVGELINIRMRKIKIRVCLRSAG